MLEFPNHEAAFELLLFGAGSVCGLAVAFVVSLAIDVIRMLAVQHDERE